MTLPAWCGCRGCCCIVFAGGTVTAPCYIHYAAFKRLIAFRKWRLISWLRWADLSRLSSIGLPRHELDKRKPGNVDSSFGYYHRETKTGWIFMRLPADGIGIRVQNPRHLVRCKRRAVHPHNIIQRQTFPPFDHSHFVYPLYLVILYCIHFHLTSVLFHSSRIIL